MHSRCGTATITSGSGDILSTGCRLSGELKASQRSRMSLPISYGAVIYAKDHRILAKFYEHVAGLTQREANEEYILLAAPSFQLVVLQIPDRLAANITIDKPPRKRESTPIK